MYVKRLDEWSRNWRANSPEPYRPGRRCWPHPATLIWSGPLDSTSFSGIPDFPNSTELDPSCLSGCPWGLWHRRFLRPAEWQCPTCRGSTDLAKTSPDRIVNPVTMCVDFFGFSSFRFQSACLFFHHLGHAYTSIESSCPLDDKNGQRIP